MNVAPLWLWLTLGCTATAVITAGLSHWWYGRRTAALERDLAKVDKARLFVGHQVAQARKQIEKLQAELLEQQRAIARAQSVRQRMQQLDIELGRGDLGQPDTTAPAPTPISFSDTQPMAEHAPV